MVLGSQSVIDRLLDEESGNVADLELFIERPIKFQVETMYTQEQYDVVLMWWAGEAGAVATLA